MNIAINGEVISVGVVILLTGAMLRNNWLESRKRKEVYLKIDTFEKHSNGEFVKKEICSLQHKNLGEDMAEVKKRTECIPSIKAGMDLLLKKNGIEKHE